MGVKKIGGDRNFVGDTIEEKKKFFEEALNRDVEWHIVKVLEEDGEDRKCEICGMEGKGGYFCDPCIHGTWCCECCILLGIPNYSTGVFLISGEGKYDSCSGNQT